MMEQKYKFTKDDVETFMGLCVKSADGNLWPDDVALQVLNTRFQDRSKEDVLAVFWQFIRMANSVVDNCRDFTELYLITDAGIDPYTAEKINTPTLFGALNGYKLAAGIDQEKTCHGCAYRIGTCANQSPITTCDAEYQEMSDAPFWCHEHMDVNEKPTRKCIGFVQKKGTTIRHGDCGGDGRHGERGRTHDTTGTHGLSGHGDKIIDGTKRCKSQ